MLTIADRSVSLVLNYRGKTLSNLVVNATEVGAAQKLLMMFTKVLEPITSFD